MNTIYNLAKQFKKRYPLTIAWRLKKHAKIAEKHLNNDETVEYVFTAQKNDNPFDIITTNIVVLTNKRIILANKRLMFGYFFTTITPDMFNDLKVSMGVLWGKIYIDTINEMVPLSNIQKEALPEIETNITKYMLRQKEEN